MNLVHWTVQKENVFFLSHHRCFVAHAQHIVSYVRRNFYFLNLQSLMNKMQFKRRYEGVYLADVQSIPYFKTFQYFVGRIG